MTRITHGVAETEAVAAELAGQLQPGQCIGLDGELGAGKTAFVRGLLRGLGGDPRQVSSPTFVLVHYYPNAGIPVFHLDAYRIGPEELEGIGFCEFLEQDAIVVVEWAGRVAASLPAGCIRVAITVTGETERKIEIESSPLPQPER